VLIADDNTENVLILQEYLGVNGYRLATARTGREFLARVRAAPPDLAILDIQMPDMDGLTALQQMRGDPTIANLPVIVLSAHAMPGDEMRALAAGANRYLSKPVALAEIARAVASLLEASR
jgi:CheY-like chemotaxis protein